MGSFVQICCVSSFAPVTAMMKQENQQKGTPQAFSHIPALEKSLDANFCVWEGGAMEHLNYQRNDTQITFFYVGVRADMCAAEAEGRFTMAATASCPFNIWG